MKSSAKKIELASVDDLFSTEEGRQDAKLEKIQEIPLSELHPFKNHPFKVKDDEAMMETADSIKQYGVLVPAIAETDITDLYDMFEDLSLEDKQVEETTGADVTSFRFNLSDGTNYELIYVCNGVKNGKLKSPTGNFEYFTSSDIGSYWSNIDLEAVPVEESELPK